MNRNGGRERLTALLLGLMVGLVIAPAARAEEWVEPANNRPGATRRSGDLLERAQQLSAEGQVDAAIREYQIAIQADPHHVEALYQLANLFARLKRWAQTAATAEKAYKIDNRNADVQALWGHALLRMGRHPEAIWVLEGVVRLNSGRSLAQVYYDLGQACFAMKWLDRSVDYALRHLQLKDTPQGHALLARSYLAQGHREKALSELQRSVHLYEQVEDAQR
ncbi:MAG: tetratricopeptide repeat protein [Candidatus Sericytochromatia bacterium]|nr:tetratricopeptide repeat protein [Candidatus Sericytochromatia bacterium]